MTQITQLDTVAVLRVHEIFEVATKSTIDFDLQLASGASSVGRHPFFPILAPYLSIIVTGPCIAAFISYLYRSEALVPLSSTRAQEPRKLPKKNPFSLHSCLTQSRSTCPIDQPISASRPSRFTSLPRYGETLWAKHLGHRDLGMNRTLTNFEVR